MVADGGVWVSTRAGQALSDVAGGWAAPVISRSGGGWGQGPVNEVALEVHGVGDGGELSSVAPVEFSSETLDGVSVGTDLSLEAADGVPVSGRGVAAGRSGGRLTGLSVSPAGGSEGGLFRRPGRGRGRSWVAGSRSCGGGAGGGGGASSVAPPKGS